MIRVSNSQVLAVRVSRAAAAAQIELFVTTSMQAAG